MSTTCEVSAVEIFKDSRDYQWEHVECGDRVRRFTLFPGRGSRRGSGQALAGALDGVLSRIRPDVVAIPGWSHPGAIAALSWCCDRRVPRFVMSESGESGRLRLRPVEWAKGEVVSLFGAALVGGSPHARYIEALGMRPERVFLGYDVVDNEHFRIGADRARGESGSARARMGLARNYFLAIARFIKKKNLLRLIEAYSEYVALVGARPGGVGPQGYSPGGSPWDLVLLGDGPLRGEIEKAVHSLGLDGRVVMPGFVQYEALPAYYGLAGAFVLPSTFEPWGLVANEVMAAGLPVLLSRECGCAENLLREGGNGFAFDSAIRPRDGTLHAGHERNARSAAPLVLGREQAGHR